MDATATSQVPGIYRRRIGEILVTALCDGYLDADPGALRGIAPDRVAAVLREGFRPFPPRIAVDAFLVQAGERTALIETGSGDSMGPTLGHLVANLRAASTAPEAVEVVLLTHMHPDHSNGLRDPSGGRVFPDAELVVHAAELRHWQDDAAMSAAPERKRLRYFRAARHQMEPYRDRLRPIISGEVFPGVTAVPIPGHTPGHTAYRIADGADTLLIWGDTVHIPEIQTRHPEVTLDFDTDPVAAAATRRRLFDMVATDRMLVGGMHIHFPGFAHLARHGEGYVLVPEAWSPAL